jgi:hypothetical protein
MKASALVMVVMALVALVTSACAPTGAPGREVVCDRFDTSVFGGTDPINQSTFLTTSPEEAADLTRRGYTYKELLGPRFMAASAPADGLLGVHRLYRAKNRDFLWSTDAEEISTQIRENDYADQGIAFYLAAEPSDCVVPVHRYVLRGQHRLVLEGQEAHLQRLGWKDEGVKFYSAPSTFAEDQAPEQDEDSPKFTFAVMPDTQLEAVRADDSRTRDRSVWLVENQKRLNLAFVVHVGDIVEDDERRLGQYKRARQGIAPLRAAGIPYIPTVGDHDTAATCDEAAGTCSTPAAARKLRDTSVVNRYFPSTEITNLKGQFEKGKVDNAYGIYEAGGLKWMVLTLESWARPEAVQWANEVVSSHPDANVIVTTHMYLTRSGEIGQTEGGFRTGATSPQYLFDNLIKRHENIKIVLSGHTGAAARRTDKGVKGNRIYSFLQSFHDKKYNPTRLVEVDTARKTLTSSVYVPAKDVETPGTRVSFDRVDWTR